MKKMLYLLLSGVLLLQPIHVAAADINWADLSDQEIQAIVDAGNLELSNRGITTTINPSPDKYTWYVKDYKGRNAASFDKSWFCYDRYGDAVLKLVLTATDGSFIDVSDNEMLKEYVVSGQNLQPNTEIKLIYETDENGEETNLLESQSYEEIELYLTKIEVDD